MTSFGNKYRGITPYLVFVAFTYLQGAFLFGIDTGSFGSLQALPSFLDKFGQHVPGSTKLKLSSSRKSVMNSVPFAGKFVGTMLSEPMIDRMGYKKVMVSVGILQCLALIIEMSSNVSGSWGQFTAGRSVAYLTVGIVENAVTNYHAEIAPASVRGLFAGAISICNALGNFWGTGMSRAYRFEKTSKGWLVPVGVHFIPAILILFLLWFTPESPRWLVLKGRKEEALKALDRLRPAEDVDNGYTEAEIEAIELSFQEQGGHNQGQWLDLFRGNYLRRTWIATRIFIFQEFNGNQFNNSYGATFYVQYGLGAKTFTYTLIGNSLQVANAAFQIATYDHIGRRFFSVVGGFFGTLFLSVVAGVGGSGVRSDSAVHAVVASMILVPVFSRWGVANGFVIGSEIGGVKLRKKMMAFGTGVNVLSAILLTSVIPYLMDDGPGSAGLGPKVGWIFAACCFLLMLFGIFFIPELTGRSLEEVDELFEAGLIWGWQFKTYKTTGAGSRITALEQHQNGTDPRKVTEEVHHLEEEAVTDAKARELV